MKLNKDLPQFASDIKKLMNEKATLPPVETWQPKLEGEIDIRIGRDGQWYYQGEKMERLAMVQLFSSIMRRDGDEYFLVTPVEKMKIVVDDAPFVVNLMDVEGEGEAQVIHFSTSLGDCFALSVDHPLHVECSKDGGPSPYVCVRQNLNALINRAVYYELADLVVPQKRGSERMGIWSQGDFYPLS